ncbi:MULTISPECIES: virulence-associated E family protein [unclassified Nitrobacter]|uniref:virulence-associated E family protein n=1 Tax=unclassified Nitrobacter TaxID=2620411 RepID=UPI00092B2E59|nr:MULTISPECIES: virulence-associated E family protein [unclassified Nitrobacter]MBN9149160.1 hypothetical protein [Nitrobacter sp.]OJV00597.1 MAG: hypothetical protein BGO16_11010 [Nitrobacter sp. 62-23]
MTDNSIAQPTNIPAPRRGWDNQIDLEDAKQRCIKNASLYRKTEEGLRLLWNTAQDFFDWGVTPESAANIICEYGSPKVSRTAVIDIVYRAYASKSDKGNVPGRNSRAPLPEPLPDDDESDDWMEGSDESTELIIARGFKMNRKTNVAPDTYANAEYAVLKADLKPAWNELKQNYEFRTESLPWPDDFGRVLDDKVMRLTRKYMHEQYKAAAYTPDIHHLGEVIKTLAYQNKFNPIIEYLDGLKWDGVARVDGLFSNYFECDDSEYTRAVSRCFMVGAVRRQRRPGCKFDTMPVLKGPQGYYKSTALRVLFGDEWFSDADLGNLRDKDAAMKLRGIWLQEFAEIGSLTRADADTLKAFLSRAVDRQRDPYDRMLSEVPRRSVCAATVNESGYLKDATGGRRFWPLELRTAIDVSKLARDRDQLWAEASVLEERREPLTLPESLWSVAAELQKNETADNPWEDTIADFLEQRERDHVRYNSNFDLSEDEDDDEPPPPDRVHADDLMNALDIPKAQRSTGQAQRLRTTMESMGWEHRRQVKIFGQNRAGFVKSTQG